MIKNSDFSIFFILKGAINVKNAPFWFKKMRNFYFLLKLRHKYQKIMNFVRKTEQFREKNSEISQKTESTEGLDPKILQNFGEKKSLV